MHDYTQYFVQRQSLYLTPAQKSKVVHTILHMFLPNQCIDQENILKKNIIMIMVVVH